MITPGFHSTDPIICCDCGKETPREGQRQKRCPDCRLIEKRRVQAESKRKARAADPEKYREIDMNRKLQKRAKRYGLSLEQLFLLYEWQDHRCAICGLDVFIEEVDIDHDHRCCAVQNRSCGKCIRGLICNRHNRALGMVRDSIEELYALIEYLERYETVCPTKVSQVWERSINWGIDY